MPIDLLMLFVTGFSALLDQVFAILQLIVISLTRIGDHYSLIVIVSEVGYFVTVLCFMFCYGIAQDLII